MVLPSITSYLQSVLFPVFCVQCQQEGEWWCGACRTDYPFLKKTEYFDCSSPAVNPLCGLTALFNYEERAAPALLIKELKYQGVTGMRELWRSIFYTYFSSRAAWLPEKSQPVIFIPVPLHPRRERERGFNQSLILATAAAASLAALGYRALTCMSLKRIKNTPQQARLDRASRQHNLDGAFAVNSIPPSGEIVLVDDVFTTGSTLSECARVLHTAGINKIGALVALRG